jgi:transcriptional regulator with XRE-family HTH domain
MTSDPHRAQLSEFLRSCRARLSPHDVGLPETARRRTPGLRREDVAVLAGVSLTWYTWLEQGRAVRASERVLENICTTLRMSSDERDYLFSLVQSRPAPLAPHLEALQVPASVVRMMNSLDVPAYVMTMRWDIVAWNAMVTATFRDYGAMAPDRRNLIRILLKEDPQYQVDPQEYYAIARRVLSKLRVDYSQAADDPAFDALIEEMTASCPIFAKLWGSTEICTRAEGLHTWSHPTEGAIAFEHTSYAIEGAPTLRVIIFAPQDAESAAKLHRIAARIPNLAASATVAIAPVHADKRIKQPTLQRLPS